MAAKLRHLKVKNGRYWARISIPKELREQFGGKSELTESLGGDRPVAFQMHAAAVARLQVRIGAAKMAVAAPADVFPSDNAAVIFGDQILTEELLDRLGVEHLHRVLDDYELKQSNMPTHEAITAEYDQLLARIDTGEISDSRYPYEAINARAPYELMNGAREHDRAWRHRRMTGLRSAWASGDLRIILEATRRAATQNDLAIVKGSRDWQELGRRLVRMELAALEETFRRDKGVYDGDPRAMKVPAAPSPKVVHEPPPRAVAPVGLWTLFDDYIAYRQRLNKHRDGGRNWRYPIKHLIEQVGHEDASRITKKDLMAWRDGLLEAGIAPKTIAAKYLAAIKAVFAWAHENDRLATNEAKDVRQEAARKIRLREKGYSTSEATKLLRVCRNYTSPERANPAHRERPWNQAAKRWVSFLCAFTGARVGEICQLRKEDVVFESGRWLILITPEAGSVKNGWFRKVPLHRQLEQLGFLDFVASADEGPLFHGQNDPCKYANAAAATRGNISEWLRENGLVPKGVAPNYGFRHRFKTLGLDLGSSKRVLDAIQGHPGRDASDHYGDVTLKAMLAVIDRLEPYELQEAAQ